MPSLLDNIKEAIKSIDQRSLFGQNTTENLEKACVTYLRHKGYTVSEPKVFGFNIKSTRDLVDHFYLLLNNHRKSGYYTSNNSIKDETIASRFIKDRMELTGASREYTLNECGEIIKTVFDNYEDFNFDREIGFYVFGQKNLKWVTDKALQIMNLKFKDKREADAERKREKMIEMQGTESLGYDDLDDILSKLDGGDS